MRLAIMQPYFFPYLGHFQLMNAVDKWVFFDDAQFIDKGWINRNRILHPDVQKEWQYITIPLKNRRQFDKIREVTIDNGVNWRAAITGKLTCYRRKAPYYEETMRFVRDCFALDEPNLSRFVISTLKKTADLLQIKTTFAVQSALKLSLGEIVHPGQWALRIAECMGASEYVNPLGGADLFREDEFARAGIRLRFLKPSLKTYVQRRGAFVPGLSIVDVMMWNSAEDIRQMLDDRVALLDKSELSR